MKPTISLNKQLLDLVKDKNIHIVGPAPYLKGLWRGSEIDDADVVVRPNEIIPLKKLRCDYGSRTDIFFCNFGTSWMSGIKRKILLHDHEEHYKKLKLVVASAVKAKHSDLNFLSWPDNYVSDVPQNFQDINKYDLPFYWIGVRDYKELYNRVQAEFNTGLAAIMMLLEYPIKKMTISGFTFFLGGNLLEELYCEGHWDAFDLVGRTHGFTQGHSAPTNVRQVIHFKSLYERDDRIVIDNTLKDILANFDEREYVY